MYWLKKQPNLTQMWSPT